MGFFDVIEQVATRGADLGRTYTPDVARRRVLEMHDEYEALRHRFNNLVDTNSKNIDQYEALRLRFNEIIANNNEYSVRYSEIVEKYDNLLSKARNNLSIHEQDNKNAAESAKNDKIYIEVLLHRVIFLDQVAFSRAKEILRLFKFTQSVVKFIQKNGGDEAADELMAIVNKDWENLDEEFLATSESIKYGIPKRDDLASSFDPTTDKTMRNANENGVLFDQIKLFGDHEN